MKASLIFISIFMLAFISVPAQVAVNTDGSAPDMSSMLDVASTNKGVLLPRIAYAGLFSIAGPAEGLLVYCIDCGPGENGSLVIFTNGSWSVLNTNCLLPVAPDEGAHESALTQIVWHWNAVPNASGYKWNTSNDPVSSTDIGNNLSYTETGLTPNSLYTRYVWAYNTCGSSNTARLSHQTLPYSIGANYGGGIIFYIDGTENHGLIAATSDQSTGASWGCAGTLIGGTSTGIGTGQANTSTIVGFCSETGIAARICHDLELNGFDDWFLPSLDELAQIFIYRNIIGGFSTEYYFSSSECDDNKAWEKSFFMGDQGCWFKNVPHYVRAVRAF